MAYPFTTRDEYLIDHNPHAHSLVMSYLGVRRSLGMLGFLLPIMLGPIGWFVFGIEIQDHMSNYYHTQLRDVFVGVMCAMGIFLFCYHGYDRFENWTGKLACASAIGVAIFPLDPNSDPLQQSTLVGYIHSLSGGMFFTTLALYSLYHFPRGHFGLRLKTRDEQRDGVYLVSGLTILSAIVLMGIHLFLLPGSLKEALNRLNFIFWMEWVAIWAFAIAWLTKGQALLSDSKLMAS